MPDKDTNAAGASDALRLDRRAWVKASLSVGFCAAISPALGQVIATSAEGLVAGEVKVPSGDIDMPASIARCPIAAGRFRPSW